MLRIATVRRLDTDLDLQDAQNRKLPIRVFENNHYIESGSIILRFTTDTVITQKGVSEISYHNRDSCQFFELKRN